MYAEEHHDDFEIPEAFVTKSTAKTRTAKTLGSVTWYSMLNGQQGRRGFERNPRDGQPPWAEKFAHMQTYRSHRNRPFEGEPSGHSENCPCHAAGGIGRNTVAQVMIRLEDSCFQIRHLIPFLALLCRAIQ